MVAFSRSRFEVLLPVVLFGVVSLAGDTASAETSGVLRAGAAAVDITPGEFPVKVVGGFFERTATTVHDRLYARCLVLDGGEVRVAIVVVDSCLVPRDLFDRAKALAREAVGLAPERMLMSATHTHSAPAAVGALGTDVDEKYREFLPGRIAEAVRAAVGNLAPARIGWAVVSHPEHTHCRRWLRRPDRVGTDPFGHRTVRAMMHPGHQNPDYTGPSGPVDPDLSILAVQTPNGKPIALLANYSMHYVGAPPLSADYFGVFSAKIAELIGAADVQPPFVGMMSNGTSGDLMFMDYSKPAKKQDMYSIGEAIARVAAEAYGNASYHDRVPLVMREKKLLLEVRPISDADFARAKEAFARFADRKPRTREEVYAREQVLLSRMPATRELKLQALSIGELGIVAIPCEVFGITGLKIKAQSPLRPTFTIGLANGCEGYIPPPEQHELGGYTTWRARTACLEVEAEPKIVAAVLALLEEVSGKARSSR